MGLQIKVPGHLLAEEGLQILSRSQPPEQIQQQTARAFQTAVPRSRSAHDSKCAESVQFQISACRSAQEAVGSSFCIPRPPKAVAGGLESNQSSSEILISFLSWCADGRVLDDSRFYLQFFGNMRCSTHKLSFHALSRTSRSEAT